MPLSPKEEAELRAEVNERSQKLIEEFHEHERAVQAGRRAEGKPPGDPRQIFEGWAIQKIAGLQCQLFRQIQAPSARR